METLRFRITSESPLVMHNRRLADPLDKWARAIKEISGKRKKTDDDHMEMARLEFCGGLYLSDGKPCIPAYIIERALVGKGGPARRVRKGVQAAAGLVAIKDAVLEYEGPTDVEEMWADEKFRLRSSVTVQSSRIMRTRPIFHEWAAEVEVMYNPGLINRSDVVSWMKVLGEEIGIMDWRPKFGRFTVEVLD